jgi:ATP-dependent helicase/nuclease subunit A
VSPRSRAALELADLEARGTAQREFERPLVLEAGAGTGKTAILVARLLAWALGAGWERGAAVLAGRRLREGRRSEPGAELVAAAVLDRVVAITFTDAAAAEMAERVASTLSAIVAGATPPWLDDGALPPNPVRVDRAGALLVALDRLVVCTIHAYCRRLLSRYPLEAGLHPEFTVDAEGLALDQVVHEVVQDHLRRAFAAPGDPQALALAAMGVTPGEIGEALALLVARGVPPEALVREPYGAETVTAMRRRVIGAIADLRASGWRELASARNQKIASEVLDALAGTEQRLESLGAPDVARLETLCAALRQSWPRELRVRLRDWGRGKPNKGEAAALGERAGAFQAAASLLWPALDAWLEARPALLDAAFRVLAPLLGEVQRTMRSRGAATFDDLLRLARNLLGGHPEIAARERAGISQLLVDEFQDTDRMQCEMLRALALDGATGERPGLFLVGDPKQSIYGWRSADLAAYEWFVGAVEASGGRRMRLSINFRSVPAILDEVERAVAPSMIARPSVQPPFEPLAPSPENAARAGFTAEGRAAVEYWVSWLPADGAKTRSADAAALEARAIAADIRQLHDAAAVPWRGFGVLLRAGSDLDDYLQALRGAGVPYTVERDRSYYRRREVIEAAALVRTVLDPTDHLAMVTWLRSPSVGVPDAALMPLWSQGLPGLLTDLVGPEQDRLAELSAAVGRAAALVPADVPGIDRVAGWPTALIAAVEDLATLRASFGSQPAALFVERLRTITLIEATEAARVLGAFRVANLDRFFRLLLTAMEASGADPQAVLRALRRAVTERQEAEEGRPLEAVEDAVRVMTIHKAKGLHFDHTYVVQTHKRTRSNVREGLDAARTDGGWQLRLFGAPTPGWREVEARREQVRDAELVRTLYVALTRARERLVVLGRWAPGPPSGAASSHLDLLRRRSVAPPDLEQLAASLEGAGEWWIDAASARWVFPGLAPEPPEPVGAEAAANLPAVAEVRRQQQRLAALALRAEERMRRPFVAPATEEAHRALAGGQEGVPRRQASAGRSRGLAMAVGSAVHRVLEAADLEGGPLARAEDLARALVGSVPPAEIDDGVARAQALLARLAASPLARRLAAAAPHVLGREVPVLVPAEADGEGPVGYVAGVIDLLQRDPATGEVVVVDYKTDAVDAGEELERRAAAYALQGRVYARAVQEALGLPSVPRVELWFLWPGIVRAVDG